MILICGLKVRFPRADEPVQRLVEFYVREHNRVLQYSAFRGQTPDEMCFDTGDIGSSRP
jgi:hypothetical protein